MKFGIVPTTRPARPRFLLEKEDMAAVGKKSVELTKARIRSGRDHRGQPKKPLSGSYMARKYAAGKHLKRDLELTGKFLSQLRSWGATRRKVRVGWTSEYGKTLAQAHKEPGGLAPNDRKEIAKLLEQFTQKRAAALRLFKK